MAREGRGGVSASSGGEGEAKRGSIGKEGGRNLGERTSKHREALPVLRGPDTVARL